MSSLPPSSLHKTQEQQIPRPLRALVWFANGFEWLQIFAVLLFLIFFPPLALYNGMLLAALVLSLIGLWATWYSMTGEGRWPKIRRFLSLALFLEHGMIFSLALWAIIQPPRGGWKKTDFRPLQSTNVKIFTPRPDLLLAWTEEGRLFQWHPQKERWTYFTSKAPRFSGWVVAYDPFRDWMWFGLHDDDRLNFYDYKKERWKGLPCPEGQVRALALWQDRIFAVINSRLYITGDRNKKWSSFRCGGYCSSIASNNDPQKPYLFATGKRWFESTDGGFRWKDITPPPELISGLMRVHLGEQGMRYAFQGGLLSGRLVVAPPNGGFQARTLPASDIRTLITDPQDDRRIWIGTWGQGVFFSPDAGKTWKDLGLQHVEIRYLALYQNTLYAGSSNMLLRRGLYKLSLPQETSLSPTNKPKPLSLPTTHPQTPTSNQR